METSEDKQESESDSEEENEYQEKISLEDKDGNEKCSVCMTGGSVFSCKECNTSLHKICAQTTTPFLCKFCLRKKLLRERESKTDDMLDRDDSNSEVDQDDGERDAVYSASPLIIKSLPEAEYAPSVRLVVEPFSIGSQNDQESRRRRVLWRNIETKSGTSSGE